MENAKVYVDVLVNFDKDGTMSPVDFIREDGEKYHVDRILARERCASRKAGGTGKYNIWKHVIDAHYILCYSIIELSFMHSTLYREI